MPWRKVTHVPFVTRGTSEPESHHDTSSELEVHTNTPADTPEFSLPDLEQCFTSGFSNGSECQGEDRESEPQGASIRWSEVSETTVDIEPISVTSFNQLVAHSFLSNAQVHNICLPWESALGRQIFGDDSQAPDNLTMPPFWTADQISLLADEGADSQYVAGELSKATMSSGGFEGVSFFRAVSNLTDHSFLEKRNIVLESACSRWLSILKLCPNSSSVSQRLHLDESSENFSADMAVIKAIIGVRSPSTSLTRANMVRKYLAWVFQKFPHVDLPFCESLLWQYFSFLRETNAAPTTAASTLSAMRYAQHIFSFECLAESTSSRRLIGCSEIMYSEKDAVRQAVVLTVQNVLTLHSLLADTSVNVFDRAGAGFMLLCIYGRCRHSDLSMVDRVEHDHNAMAGYVEVFTRYHKTARGAAKKAMFLPILVPAIGITNNNWVVEFCEALELCGMRLNGQLQGPILRPPTDVHASDLCKRGLTSEECSRLLRSLLGLQIESIGRSCPIVSSHSLKATGLSWASKFGVPEFDRAVLGRHSSTTSSATAIYSRDLSGASVRKFETVLKAIFNKTFLPDAPRSAYFVEPEKSVSVMVIDESPRDVVKEEVSSSDIKSEPMLIEAEENEPEIILSSSEDSSDLDIDESSDEDYEGPVLPRQEKVRRVLGRAANTGPEVWFAHKRSGILHLCNHAAECFPLERRYFKCGRVISANYSQMSERESGNQMCILCNRKS